METNQPANSSSQSVPATLVLTGPDGSTQTQQWMWAALLVLLALLAYFPALRAGFINWDDPRQVTENRLLHSVEGLRNIWGRSMTETDPSQFQHVTAQYYPLTYTVYWLEYQLWGLNPLGYHLVNVLLHASNAVLLWFILRRLALPGAWMAAAVFAIHPIEVESVAWVSELKNVLSGLFCLASIRAYLQFAGLGDEDQAKRRAWYAAAVALFVCAMLSKTVACSTPVVMGLVLWWKRGRIRRSDVASLMPLLLLGVAMGLLTAWLERHRVGAVGADWNLSPMQRVLLAGNALWFYAGKLLWPLNLAFSYPRWAIDEGDFRWYVLPLLGIVIVAALWALRNRIGRGALTGVLIFAGALFPALGFVNVYPMLYSLVADHFQYLAGIAIVVMTVTAAAKAMSGRSVRAMVLAGLVLLMLGMLSRRQSTIYANDETLWRDTLAKNDSSWMARYNLGLTLADQAARLASDAAAVAAQGRDEEARQLSDSVRAKRQEAMAYFQATIALRPRHDKAYDALGRVLVDQRRLDEAIEQYAKSLAINPDSVQAHTDMALAMSEKGNLADAMPHIKQAIRLQPKWSKVHYLAANILRDGGRDAEAATEYEQTLKLNPGSVSARLNLGLLLKKMGKKPEAFDQFSVLGEMENGLRRRKDAESIARYAGDFVRALTEMGFMYAEQKQYPASLQCFMRATEIDPASPEAKRGMDLLVKLVAPATTQKGT